MELKFVDPRSLKDNPDKARRSKSSPQADALLLATIKAVGIVQPPVVATEADAGNGFVIDEGHRRVKQAIAAGLEQIAVLVVPRAEDGGAMRSLVTTIAHEQLNPADQWRAIERVVALGWTEEAIVAENAYAMVPGRNGGRYLAHGRRLARPMTEWTRSDFYGHGGDLADETALRSKVLEQAQHLHEKRALSRREIQSGAHTPWGPSQGGTVYAEGVTSHSTAGHGGFELSAERNRKVHPMLRAGGGWYEEDERWAIVAFTFPHLFTTLERRHAEQTIKESWPDAWEAISGTILAPGESRRKDQRAFEAEHAADWIVVSAITSEQQGFVECVATPGGKRGAGTEERRFLVPADEYDVGGFGFVIDPDRHAVYAGPSGFVSWRGRRSS